MISVNGLALSRRWLFCTELILPAIVFKWIIISCLFSGNIRGGVSREVRLMSQLWVFIMWSLSVCFLRTDYLTSLWRPILMMILYFVCSVGIYSLATTPLVYRVVLFMIAVICVELPHHRSMSE